MHAGRAGSGGAWLSEVDSVQLLKVFTAAHAASLLACSSGLLASGRLILCTTQRAG